MRTIVIVFNENYAFNSYTSLTSNLIVFMNSIQFKHNYQIMGDFYLLIKNFVEFLQRFFTKTLKGHISVTNKDTEMRQHFHKALFVLYSACPFSSRSVEPRSRSTAGWTGSRKNTVFNPKNYVTTSRRMPQPAVIGPQNLLWMCIGLLILMPHSFAHMGHINRGKVANWSWLFT